MFKGGIIAALVTPYTKDGELDSAEVKRLVRHLIDQGIEGFYVCGTTGEAFLLSMEDRMRMLEAVLEENNGKKTVICHCGTIATNDMTKLARHAERAGVDAVSAIPPFYYSFSEAEILGHYEALANSVDLPVVVYNFAAVSGFKFTIELFDKLFHDNSNIFSIKHTSYDLYMMERIKQKYPNSVIFNGHDEVWLSGLVAGADGAIGSTFNAIPKIYMKVRERYLAGDMAGAKAAQHDANDFIDVLLKFGTMQVIKEFLLRFGIDCHGLRLPFLPVSEEGIAAVKVLFEHYVNTY